MSVFELPKLPYEAGDLAPIMSKETVEYHYGKHLQTYITNLNNLKTGSKYENMSLEQIVKSSEGAIFNNSGQVLNHTLFFMQLSPKPKTAPSGALAAAIDRDFGSMDALKEVFEKAAVGQFGSGWAWLASDGAGKLSILATSNADNPLTKGLKPLLTIDVWEHAYYIDYRNRRADFAKAIWALYDWAVVEQRYK